MLYGYSMGNMNIVKLTESGYSGINNIISLPKSSFLELLSF
jgi:hypothetical protein